MGEGGARASLFCYHTIVVIIFTGNGKGKTTAALGQMVRALGRGRQALMIQFIKGPWKSGEDYFGTKFQIPGSRFQVQKMGLGFVGILGDKLPRSAHKRAAQKALAHFRKELRSGRWDVIVLDEVNVAVSLKLISSKQVLVAIQYVPFEKLVILTGRNAPKSFVRRADLVTEMCEIKHPFNRGEIAKLGIEF